MTTNYTAMMLRNGDVRVTTRARAWSGHGVELILASVEPDGTVRVWDDVAGAYTLVHSLSRHAQRRIARIASAVRI